MPANNSAVTSIQPRFETTRDQANWLWTIWDAYAGDAIPPWGSSGRTDKLIEFSKAEPILSGALASMVSKAISLDWQIEGGRNRVRRYQEILAEAEAGQGWSFFLDRLLQDYLVTDLGGVVELGRQGPGGPVVGLFNLDAGTLALTGNADFPLRYQPRLASGGLSGRAVPLAPSDFGRIVDMPSTQEHRFGLGFCAVSRALKAARVLLALYNYDEERLADMPLPGIVAITGMTQTEVKAAFDLYKASREAKEQTTFKGLLWLAAQASPINPIKVDFTPFAGIPEGFDREQAVTHYVYTLSLDFGVDVREFWPASQTGATKAEAEVQAQKAKGKGFGRMLASVERMINWDVLPEGLAFRFDQQDSEDDLLREGVRAAAVDNVRKLWEPAMGAGAGIITTDEARRWLVELDAAPDWLHATDQVTAHGDANTLDDAEAQPAAAEPVAEKARRAGLAAGEDFVRIDRAGDIRTLWTSRQVFAVPNWPRRARAEVGQDDPFGIRSTLTTTYP